jgi:hypothetical protein
MEYAVSTAMMVIICQSLLPLAAVKPKLQNALVVCHRSHPPALRLWLRCSIGNCHKEDATPQTASCYTNDVHMARTCDASSYLRQQVAGHANVAM